LVLRSNGKFRKAMAAGLVTLAGATLGAATATGVNEAIRGFADRKVAQSDAKIKMLNSDPANWGPEKQINLFQIGSVKSGGTTRSFTPEAMRQADRLNSERSRHADRSQAARQGRGRVAAFGALAGGGGSVALGAFTRRRTRRRQEH
jgi:hypothetical protein